VANADKSPAPLCSPKSVANREFRALAGKVFDISGGPAGFRVGVTHQGIFESGNVIWKQGSFRFSKTFFAENQNGPLPVIGLVSEYSR